MINVVKEPCTAIFSGPTKCGKTQKVLNLIENEYKQHFRYIIILCPTLKWNETYLNHRCLWLDDDVFLIDPKDRLYDWIVKFSSIFAGDEVLFIIDDCISDKNFDKRRTPLLELAISGRHKKHSLWLLTQVYTAIPKDIRRQCKMLFTWYPKERSDMKLIDEETNFIDDWSKIKEQLKQSKYASLYIRLEHPMEFKIVQ